MNPQYVILYHDLSLLQHLAARRSSDTKQCTIDEANLDSWQNQATVPPIFLAMGGIGTCPEEYSTCIL